MKIYFVVLFVALFANAAAQLDFSIYDEVVVVKSNTVPNDIKKHLAVHPMLNYTEIGAFKYPDNIVRETNILNHLYDNYWHSLKEKIEKNVDKLCINDDTDLLEDMKYLYKIHRQYMKNIYHVTSKNDANCRVCDPFAYWFKLRLEEYSSQWQYLNYFYKKERQVNNWNSGFKILQLKRVSSDLPYENIILIEVNKTQPQLREITRAVEMADATKCAPILLDQLAQLDNMFEMFYQIFLRERPF